MTEATDKLAENIATLQERYKFELIRQKDGQVLLARSYKTGLGNQPKKSIIIVLFPEKPTNYILDLFDHDQWTSKTTFERRIQFIDGKYSEKPPCEESRAKSAEQPDNNPFANLVEILEKTNGDMIGAGVMSTTSKIETHPDVKTLRLPPVMNVKPVTRTMKEQASVKLPYVG